MDTFKQPALVLQVGNLVLNETNPFDVALANTSSK